eukprot:768533_1
MDQFIQYLSSLTNKEVKQLIIAGLHSYSHLVFPSPIPKPHVLLAGSLSEYIQLIIVNTPNMVQTMVQSNDKLNLPLQIDLWILSKVHHVERSIGMTAMMMKTTTTTIAMMRSKVIS